MQNQFEQITTASEGDTYKIKKCFFVRSFCKHFLISSGNTQTIEIRLYFVSQQKTVIKIGI